MKTELLNYLKQFKKISVAAHFSPDADAYGSLLGIYIYLKNNNFNVEAVNESGQQKKYNFLPNFSEINNSFSDSDAILLCDCGQLDRVGDRLINEIGNRKIINIDHHISNSNFGNFNIVDTKASSTCEIIYNLLKDTDISSDIATCLYSGIFADTGGFKYSNTTQNTFLAASNLATCGINTEFIANQLFSNNELSEVMLHARALSKLQTFFDNQYSEIILLPEDFDGLNSNVSEGLAEKARDIRGVQISALIRWDENLFKVSLRSKSDKYNVSDLAAKFGGGGHLRAAAFRWRKSLDELLVNLRTEIENCLK